MAALSPVPDPKHESDMTLKYLLFEFTMASRRLHALDMEPSERGGRFVTESLRRWQRQQDQLCALAAVHDWLERQGGSYDLEGTRFEIKDGYVRMTVLNEESG